MITLFFQNLSDHNAIRLVLDIDVNYVVLNDLDAVRAQSCDWAKATENQLELYKQQLNSQLSSIVLPVEAVHCCDTNCSKHNQSLEACHDAIISCCITSGTESIPLKGGGGKSRVNLVQVACQVGLSMLSSPNSVFFSGIGCGR